MKAVLQIGILVVIIYNIVKITRHLIFLKQSISSVLRLAFIQAYHGLGQTILAKIHEILHVPLTKHMF